MTTWPRAGRQTLGRGSASSLQRQCEELRQALHEFRAGDYGGLDGILRDTVNQLKITEEALRDAQSSGNTGYPGG